MPNPNPSHNPTDGLLSAAYVQVSGTGVVANKTVAAGKPNPANYSLTLSLGGTATCQLTPAVVDVNNTALPAPLTLASVAASVGATAVYTGTITGGGANAFAGMEFTVAGFAGANNNGTFICSASTTTTLTLSNAAATVETHAATASSYVGTVQYKSLNNPNAGSPAWYKPSNLSPYTGDIASVSAGGLITALAVGQAIIEISFPVFDNSFAAQNGLAAEAIYTQIVVTVTP